ncbi:hypothetical protein [Ornithinimicrobium avium]|uniref:Uncharacterized protein n=1 Tax=Ornithinimicrobium avium TaxID=2283195 RepID=A0A345NRM4_9MICO|nr:hypothetical protein [Ornithinimicrobium avium]AXH97682.1 hypothetical protein DV701_17610 [Ornithinimicrobium avium]
MNLGGVARTDRILDELGGRLDCSATADDDVVAALAAWVGQLDELPVATRRGRHRAARGRRMRGILGGGAVVLATLSGASVAAALTGAEVPAMTSFGRAVVEMVPGDVLHQPAVVPRGEDPLAEKADDGAGADAAGPRPENPATAAAGDASTEGAAAVPPLLERAGDVRTTPARSTGPATTDGEAPAVAGDLSGHVGVVDAADGLPPSAAGLDTRSWSRGRWTAPGQQKKAARSLLPPQRERVLPGLGWVGAGPSGPSAGDPTAAQGAAAEAPVQHPSAGRGRPATPPGQLRPVEVAAERGRLSSTPPGQAVREQVPPGQAVREQVPPGQAVKEQVPPGQAVKEQVPPGQAVREQVPPGQAAKKQMPPGQAVKEQVPPGQAVKEQVPPGQAAKKQVPADPATLKQVPPTPADGDPLAEQGTQAEGPAAPPAERPSSP